MRRPTQVALALLWLAACRERDAPLDARASSPAPPPATRTLYPTAFVDLVASARHGVVGIRSIVPVKSGPAAMFPGAPESAADTALGTGFLIKATELYVLTNDHIATAAPELRVVLEDGTELKATVRGRDPRLDLALLAIENSESARLIALPLGSSDGLQVGESVIVLGDAFGDGVTASAGILSSTGHDSSGSIAIGGAMGFRTYLQTDARIHRGNSGGPVLDTAGQVVGVAVATGDRPGEVSFAIPIDRVREVITALRDRGTVARSWLGVLVKPVTPELALLLGLRKPRGALVTELRPGSPAAQSTLRPGDVILAWDHHDVDEKSLPALVATTPPNTTITVSVWRTGAQQDLPIVTAAMPQ